MSYAIKNLREIEDSAPKFGFGDFQEARFPAQELGAEKTGFSYQVVKPGRRHGFAHRHDVAEEIYVVLRGSGRVKLDDEVHDVGEYDAVRVSARVARAFEAGPEGLELLAFGVSQPDDRGEIISREEFWGRS